MARMKILRWFMVAPGAILAWYLVFIVGVFTFPMVEKALCPPGDMISGMCGNEKVQGQLDLLIHFFVGMSALAVVSAAATIAPSRKRVDPSSSSSPKRKRLSALESSSLLTDGCESTAFSSDATTRSLEESQ